MYFTESWIVTGDGDTGVSAIIKDAFVQYQRLSYHKLTPDKEKRCDVEEHVDESNTPKLRLIRVDGCNMPKNAKRKVKESYKNVFICLIRQFLCLEINKSESIK